MIALGIVCIIGLLVGSVLSEVMGKAGLFVLVILFLLLGLLSFPAFYPGG